MNSSFFYRLRRRLNLRSRRGRRVAPLLPAAQVLESRQLLSANAVDIAQLSDEFNNAQTLENWLRIEQTEGWNANQLQTWDINQTRPGQMTLRPETSVWYQDWRGPMVYKTVEGDFVFTTSVQITDRDDVGGSDPDHVPGDSQFSLAGLMVRTPRSITNPATDWQPGSMQDDGGNNGENYVFLSLGHATDGNFSFEAKSTRNSDSQLFLTPTQSNSARLRLARVGDVISSLYQLPGGEWRVMQRLHRPDMPATLQLGIVTYTNWEKASDFDPFTHNNSTLRAGVSDPTPYEPFDPDLDASFDYARFVRPIVPTELQGVDLVTGASEQQLLSFLGDSAGALEIASISPVTPSLRNTRVDSIDVTFSREIDPATFDWRDVVLTLDDGPNRMTRFQTVTPLSGDTFRIGNLGRLTSVTGTFRLTVQAGEVMDAAGRAGAGARSTMWETDVSAPQTTVASVDRSSGAWTVAMTGRDVGSAGLASFELWVSVDGAPPRRIGRVDAGEPDAGGDSHATMPYRPLADGNMHDYRFYTIGRDLFGRSERAPGLSADILVSAAVQPLTVVEFDVESGAAQRSRVTSLVVTFDSADVLPLMLATLTDGNSPNDAFRLIRRGLAGEGGTQVRLAGNNMVVGSSIHLDLGPRGLTTDGYYELQFDTDGDGTLESSRRFYRLRGDLNGDRQVDAQDEVVFGQFLGQVGVGHFADLSGNGIVDLSDRNSLRRLFGRALGLGLNVDD